MMALFHPALVLLNATLIAWLGYYVFRLPGDPLGYALLLFLPANLIFLVLVRRLFGARPV
jgi:ABC-type branched-subunit amino acid transport system permease subunit